MVPQGAKLLKRISNKIKGSEIVPPPTQPVFVGYDMEMEAYDNIQLIKSHTMVPNGRLVTLYQQVVFCEKNGVRGSFVECGTWRGGAVGLMALGNLKHGLQRRHLHLFDSFEGIPEPDELVDGEEAIQFARKFGRGASGRLVPIAEAYDSVGTLEINKKLLEEIIKYEPNFIHYHKGWFQDTLPTAAKEIGEIAILRLDADWYASTKVCLEHLYDRVVAGGFVIVDDYGCYEGCRKSFDEFMACHGVRAYLNHIDSHGRYLIKP
jgi:O-methyltransferase